MHDVPPLSDGESSRQDLQKARQHLRRRYRLRRTAFAVMLVVILTAIGYGLFLLLGDDTTSTAGVTSVAAIPSRTTALGSASNEAGDGQDGTEATTGQATVAASTPSSAPITSPPRVNLPRQRLEVTTNPEITNLEITLQDGTVLTGKTPFSYQVPGGDITLRFQKKGYNVTTKELTLDNPRSLKVWMDPEGLLHESVIRYKCGPNPKQVAFTPDGEEMWVSLLGGHGLEIYEPTTGEKIDGVKLGEHGAVEVIFTKDGKTAYASQMETASVFEIDRATRQVRRTFKTGGEWTKVLLLSPDEETIWATNWITNDVSEIDLTTGKLVRRMKTVVTPRGLYVTPDGGRLFVAGFENGDIQRIDLATGKGEVLYKTGGAMRHMVGDDSRGLLYVDDLSTKEVFVVDLATEKVTKLADTDERPNTMDLSPDGKVLYISCRGKDNPKTYYIPGPEWGSVLAVDTATGKILDAIVGGNQCTGLDVSPDGILLAFSDFLDNKIRVYTIPDYETLAAGGGGRAEEHLVDIVKR